MAEINIEKKTPKWPWILLALVIIIGILLYVFALNGDDEGNDEYNRDKTEETTEEREDTRQSSLSNSTVLAYVSFINEDSDSMGLDHEFTNEALSRLTEATNAMANEINHDIRKDIDTVRTLTEKITTDPYETTHANSIKEVAGILAQALQNMQQHAFPDFDNEADEVKNAASDIETDVLTLEQKEAVKNFFSESANLLEKMNNNSPEI